MSFPLSSECPYEDVFYYSTAQLFFLLVICSLSGYGKKKYFHKNEISYSMYLLLMTKARC